MNPHSLMVLEFEKVRRMLFRWTFSALGRKRVEALGFDAPLPIVLRSQRRIEEWKRLELRGDAPGPAETEDLRPVLSRLEKSERPLSGEELYPFVSLLDQMQALCRVRDQFCRPVEPGSVSPAPELAALLDPVADIRPLYRRLSGAISSTGELLPDASPALARARKKLFDTQQHASQQTQKLLDQLPDDRREDTFVTLRDGRYVLSVRSNQREVFGGLLHGRSQTGQSVLVEPIEAIELNNRVAERREDVHQEEQRIFRELTDTLRLHREDILDASEIVADCDLIRAGARLALLLDASAPGLNDEGMVRIVSGRHPILVDQEREGGAAVVPLDLEIDPEAPVLLISGPNMGGKTVALKTLGLLSLMARAGLHVPADPGTDLPWIDDLFVDLGDEQSIENELSTFAAHLKHIGEMWDRAGSSSLVLLDELGGGTDPEEGAALAMALLADMEERRTLTVATTHLTTLKLFAQERPGMRNGSMAFDTVSLEPRFQLQVGEPGRSRAFDIARRILPGSTLLDRAQDFRTPRLVEMDQIFERVDAERRRLAAEREAAETARKQLEAVTRRREQHLDKLRRRIESVHAARDAAAAEAYRLAETEIREIKETFQRELNVSGQDQRVTAARRAERGLQHRRLARESGGDLGRQGGGALPPAERQAGAEAWVEQVGSMVRIERVDEGSGKARVDWQGRHFEVPIEALEHPPAGARRASQADLSGSGSASLGKKQSSRGTVRFERTETEAVARELDLRGRTADEALEELDRFLDQAAIQSVGSVRIIHGKGTGTLKRKVEVFLRGYPLVDSFRVGEPGEGGWGVTIASLGPGGE